MGENVTDKLLNKMLDVMLMSVRCLLACSCLVQQVEGQPKAYKSHFSWVGGLFRLVNKGCVMWTRARAFRSVMDHFTLCCATVQSL